MIAQATQRKSLIQRAMVSKEAYRNFIKELTPRQLVNLKYQWDLWKRPEQCPPDVPHQVWMYLGGRGTGKTRAGAEWVRRKVFDEGMSIGHFIGPTAADVRDVMIEGPGGIMEVCSLRERPEYRPSKRELNFRVVLRSFPGRPVVKTGGCKIKLFSSEKPKRVRGPQCEFLWGDEIAAWNYAERTYDNAMFGLRLGSNPQACFTTTPRPIKIIRDIIQDEMTVVTTGTTYDNRMNLAPQFFERIIKKYEGTRLGRQELLAELLDDNPDALFNRDDIDQTRLEEVPDNIQLIRVVTAVDPAATSGDDAADTGIVTAAKGDNDHYYVMSDNTCHLKPDGWGRKAIKAYHNLQADRIVGEINNGGEMIEAVLRGITWPDDSPYPSGANISYEAVRATRGKAIRAEPVSSLYEQKRVHHVGFFPQLEDQMCIWSPNLGEKSPDRLDALVWAITSLMEEHAGGVRFI